MQVIIPNNVAKFLEKQRKGDPKGILKIRKFLKDYLEPSKTPTLLPNCKKMQGYAENVWRWRVGNYRIIGEVRANEFIIKLIEINTREKIY